MKYSKIGAVIKLRGCLNSCVFFFNVPLDSKVSEETIFGGCDEQRVVMSTINCPYSKQGGGNGC